jgi:hypothetical protein
LDLFSEHSLLFIGYGLGETIIKYSIQNARQRQNGKKHFVLKHYYIGEALTYKEEKELFASSGIDVISYIGNELHYEEMVNVIKSWSRELEEERVVMQ